MLNNKEKKILKIIMAVFLFLGISLTIEAAIEYFFIEEALRSHFFEHWVGGLTLFCVGIVALIMPQLSKSRFQDNKADNLMSVVAVLLILCSIITIVCSYIM